MIILEILTCAFIRIIDNTFSKFIKIKVGKLEQNLMMLSDIAHRPKLFISIIICSYE